jgi:hypothetical protein
VSVNGVAIVTLAKPANGAFAYRIARGGASVWVVVRA